MSISEVAQRSGITARMVRKTVDNLREGGGVNFGVYFNANAGDSIMLMVRIHWDEKNTDVGKVLGWLQTRFSSELFVPMVSATNPLLFATFIAKDLSAVTEIGREIKKNCPNITKAVTIIGEPSKTFPDIKTIRLKETLAEVGF